MKSFLLLYLTGFVIASFLTICAYSFKSFREYNRKAVIKALKDCDLPYDDEYVTWTIKKDMKYTVFLSYIGVLEIIINFADFIKNKNK